MLHYWLSVLEKGVHDSLDFIEQSKSGITFAVLVLLLTGLWLWNKHGWSDAVTNWWRTVGEGAAITFVAWVIVLLIHLIYAPFHLQYDERARTAQARADRDTATTQSLVCGADLRGVQGNVDLLGRQVTAQQTQISGQQSLIVGQQKTAATQQSTFDLCVTTLAKTNAPVPQSTTLLMRNADPPPTPQAKHTVLLLLITNKPITPVRLFISCDGTVKSAKVVPFAGVGYFDGEISQLRSSSLFLAPKRWQIDVRSPVWAPEEPLLVKLDYDVDNIGSCFVGT